MSLLLLKKISVSPWTESIILLLSRFGLAAIFWLSGQTKIEGFAFNLISGSIHLEWPTIKDSTFALFEYEYNLPIISYVLAAYLATIAEHLLSVLLLTGLMSRFAALGIFGMTLVIQIFVYPDAYPTHATWLALSAWIMYKGAGTISFDYLLRFRRHHPAG
ncbi:DoxX [Vibrio ruber DSM 16370]|uniref:DoxX n=1 Tax=Vibrio ruber (strain DSM 16370 / JCM 11486 / BCRC 17186 / CECT 7878 / LMG 23124 / VR1) TaxID=1123498 RepID=A0A1R4L9C2_VIBR1|nr:DoxX family membrane protein [Vibrio ruber]SJN53152.1 DoxX [Vibrio ruber DSM 16370]